MVVFVIFNRVSVWQNFTCVPSMDGLSYIQITRVVTRPCKSVRGYSKSSGGRNNPASPKPLNFKKSRRDILLICILHTIILCHCEGVLVLARHLRRTPV